MKWSHLPRPKRDEMARVNGQERDICHLFSVVKTVCYRFINRWSWINCLSGWIRMSSSCCICERRNVFLPPSGAHCSGNVGRESATDAADCSFLPQRPFQVIKCRAPTFSFQATNKRQRPRPQFLNECYNISLEEIIFLKNEKSFKSIGMASNGESGFHLFSVVDDEAEAFINTLNGDPLL